MATSEKKTAEPAWLSSPPSAYEIVTCYYPTRDGGLKLRPTLVTKVYQGARPNAFACDVAYGTTNLKIAKRGDVDLIIQNAVDMANIGLATATRFDLDQIIQLPWTTEFFGCWTGYPSPRIGVLPLDPYIKIYAFLMMRRYSA